MSTHSPHPKQTNNMEMQDRAQTLCWPLMNGATHHNLPPITAITSCRPTVSSAIKGADTSRQLGRNAKDEHVFTAPCQVGPATQPTARAPTPFPDLTHTQRSLGFNGPNSASPKLASVPTKSAFAVVGSPYSASVGNTSAAEGPSLHVASERLATTSNRNENISNVARAIGGKPDNVNDYVTSSNNSYQIQNYSSNDYSNTSHSTTANTPSSQRNNITVETVTKPANNYILPTKSAEVSTSSASERHGHLYTSMSNIAKPIHHNVNPYQHPGSFVNISERGDMATMSRAQPATSSATQMPNAAAYYDAVGKQPNTIASVANPYKFQVPVEYSHRPTGPRIQAPTATASVSQYHREPTNRTPNPNMRQGFTDSRQFAENMRQMEKSAHLMQHSPAQMTNFPTTSHSDQHSIIKTTNPLHITSSSSANSFNSPSYYRQAQTHPIVSPSDGCQPNAQNRHTDRNRSELGPLRHVVNYPLKAANMEQVKYYNPQNSNFSSPNSSQNYKRHDTLSYPTQQQITRPSIPNIHNFSGHLASGQTKLNPATPGQPARPQHASQYYQMDGNKHAWNIPPANSVSNDLGIHGAVAPFTSKEMQVQSPLGAAQMHRNASSNSQAYQSQMNSRDRHHSYQHQPLTPNDSLPRVNPPCIPSFASQSSPRFSPHHTSATSDNPPSTSPFSRHPSTPHSSSYSPSLPRVNFPSPVPASFSGSSASTSRNDSITTLSSKYPPNQYNQSYSKHQQSLVNQSKYSVYSNSKVYHTSQLSETLPNYHSPTSSPSFSTSSFPSTSNNRSNHSDADICRNPFELPAPSNHANPSIKLNERHHSLTYNTPPANNTARNFMPRMPAENYVSVDIRKKQQQQHDAPAMFEPTRQEPLHSNPRPKQAVMSARFPPVPQSNYDLQRQIYDRMTGLQQAPPRIMAKQEKTQLPRNPEVLPHKRESPLDLSVKTVRQSADSTRDDVDMIVSKQQLREPRQASAPKIDFTPNFAEPLVRPASHNSTFLPPVHSIRKFQQIPGQLTPPQPTKRPIGEPSSPVIAKIPKVDAWKVAMDEQIEERLKAARQSRHVETLSSAFPNNCGTSVIHETNQHKAGYLKDGNRVSQLSRTTPEHIIQQISQGVVPDSRLLQDRKVVDMLRSSLEEKEARLEALQAAARRPLAERMCVPPSYPHPSSQSAQPIAIGVQATNKYMPMTKPSSDPDLDGLAAFLAARIRTKAEMKQMDPARDTVRLPDTQGAPAVPNTSPPKLLRENRPSCEQTPAALPIPRDPTGLRSSSETSVFDFRESDSENEMPVLERQTLDGMRRPRKTHPAAPTTSNADSVLAAPDTAWDNACDMFLEQLQKRPIKRSVRRKKPNPKFFTNELDTPQYMRAPPPDNFSIKSEPEDNEVLSNPDVDVKVEEEKEKTAVELSPSKNVKDESSSDDELPGVTVVKEGRIKLITRKQRTVASDSEWDNSVADLTSVDESEASSVSDSSSDEEAQKTRSENDATRKRKCRRQGGDSDGNDNGTKPRRTRRVLASDSDSQSKTKSSRPRTRTRPLSDSHEEENSESEDRLVKTNEKVRVRTRQQTRTVRNSGRMRLRSKQIEKDEAFRPGWENDVIKFKQQLRMPDRLINVSKPKKNRSQQEGELRVKHNKKKPKDKREEESSFSRCGRFGGKMMGLRGSAGLRRSNKAVSNSKRHLNKGNKRLKLRRKFRSGLDYMRKKKKKKQQLPQGKEKEKESGSPAVTAPQLRTDAPDVSAEVKSWVVNKSAGETVLHRAARVGHGDVAAYCLETKRMEASPRDHAGYTPLHEACTRGHVAVASLLLQYGASVTESVRGGVRPLHQAAENNHLELVRLLLAYGADPQIETYTGQTALSLTSNQDIRDLILTHLSDVHGEDSYKWTFEGPASVFDPKWAVDPLANPPSPELDSDEIELEVSKAMLPPLYRLSMQTAESADRWLLLKDVLSYTQISSEEQLLSKLQMTLRTTISQQEFLEQAKPCNILASPSVIGCAHTHQMVTLLRYDDAVRKLLDIEIAIVSAHS